MLQSAETEIIEMERKALVAAARSLSEAMDVNGDLFKPLKRFVIEVLTASTHGSEVDQAGAQASRVMGKMMGGEELTPFDIEELRCKLEDMMNGALIGRLFLKGRSRSIV